ncbi:hypothetical protein M758_11G133100 [Ceratodon purpureus]|nr:hypothetical protein M758_11G133100 [Ceratodon purpureus]
MEGNGPPDFGDWGVLKNFHEGGRLMTQHFRVFLPCILSFILPAALIQVIFYQFLTGLGSPELNFLSRCVLAPFFRAVAYVVPIYLILHAAKLMFNDMVNVIYEINGSRSSAGGQIGHDARILVESLFSYKTFNRRKAKALGVGFLCYMIYVVTVTSPVNFTPENVAEMGLPPWTALVFTLPLTVLLTATTFYVILLVNLVFGLWIHATQTLILM